jgi:protein disulfide-isomerase A1
MMDLDASNFDEAVHTHPFIMVNFYAPWCGHCKKIEKDLELATKELIKIESKAVIAQIDASLPENKELSDNLGVEGYPTLVVFSDGERLSDYSGSLKYRSVVNSNISVSFSTENTQGYCGLYQLKERTTCDGNFNVSRTGVAL